MNDNKLAWILTLSVMGLISALLLLAISYSPALPDATSAAENTTTTAYARMFQERNRLQARVNYCEQQQSGTTAAYRRACEDDELAKLDEYRERIAEIDAELKKLRGSQAP